MHEREVFVPKDLVGPGAEVEIEPAHTPVVRADDEVVASRVHRDARDPLDSGLEGLEETLALQIVDAHVTLGGQEEDGLRRMELDHLHISGLLAERSLRRLGR